MTTVKLTSLRWDPEHYPRQGGPDMERVSEFAELMKEGMTFPPVKATADGLVLDGVHRVLAAGSIGWEEIEVEVIEKGSNGLLTGASLNAKHGLPLTSEEKRAVALKVLEADPTLTLDEIAKPLAVSRDRVERWTKGLRHDMTKQQKEQVRELRREGRTEKEISLEVGVPQSTVSDWLNENPQVRPSVKEETEEAYQDLLPSGSEPLADTKSPEVGRMKASLRPLQKLLDTAKDARCPDHGNETITFACGLPLEEAVNRFASQLRLLSKHLQDKEAARA